MNEFKTVSSDKALHRVFVDGLLKINSVDDKKNYRASLMVLNEKRNRNGWVYENTNKNLNQFVSIPLMCAFFDGKAHGHDFVIKKDPKTGTEYASFIDAKSEHIVGWIERLSPDGQPNSYIANIDGVDWVCIREGLLPLYYNKELVDVLEANDGKMQVSIETLVYKNRIEGDTEYEMEWSVVGVTLIAVTEAVAGANFKKKVNSYSTELEEVKLKVASLNGLAHIEPQTRKNQNSKKGETRTMAKKTMHVEDLRGKFDGYTVLGVNGLNVALLNQSNGRCCTYPFGENEDTVLPERIEEIAVNCSFGEGDNAVEVPIEQIVGSVQAQLNSTKAALDKATAENAELTAKINAMTEAEYLRRKKVVERVIRETLDDNRAQYGGDIDEHFVDDLLTDECLSNYARMEDKDGFCGENAARTEVDARCMRKLKEASKARQNAAKPVYAWMIGGEGDDGKPDRGIATAIDNILKD